MANVLTTNPMIVDTAATSVAYANPLIIKSIIVLPTDTTWVVLLKDAKGKTLLAADDKTDNTTFYYGDRGLVVQGLIVTTLTTCTLEIVLL